MFFQTFFNRVVLPTDYQWFKVFGRQWFGRRKHDLRSLIVLNRRDTEPYVVGVGWQIQPLKRINLQTGLAFPLAQLVGHIARQIRASLFQIE